MDGNRSIGRAEIKAALKELIEGQRGLDFQRIAISIARTRCPDLVASEPSHDGGEDAFVVHSASGRRLSVACSLTATLAKIRGDLKAIERRKAGTEELWFFTPRAVRNTQSDTWRQKLLEESRVHLTVFSQEEVISSLLQPEFGPLVERYLSLSTAAGNEIAALEEGLRMMASQRHSLSLEQYSDRRITPVERHLIARDIEQQASETLSIPQMAARLATGGLYAYR